MSAGDPLAVDAGLEILAAGGTAVDAAIATALAVSVVEPFASGLGGGGAALVVVPGEEPEAYDYREVVPAVEPVADVGVPGLVAGLGALHEEHASLSWTELVEPAIRLADRGVPTSAIVADQLRSAQHRLPVASLPELFPDGVALGEGDPLVQQRLAATLRRLADAGPDDLYTGVLAEELVAAAEGLDAASLAAYEVQRDPPVRGAFAGYDVLAPPPALPGAPFVQQLQVAEALGAGELEPDGAAHLHRMLQAWRVADASVSDLLGDPAFVAVPVEELTDPTRNADIAQSIPVGGPAPAAPGSQLRPPATVTSAGAQEVGNTTHITVVGPDGTIVSMTNTLTNFWGSGQPVLGFFLNDQLRRFTIGGAANQPEPGRRSVSWGLPVVLLDGQDRPVLGLGSPGGRRIPNILANVLVRWAAHEQPLQAAVDAVRFHLEDGVVEFERLPSDEVVSELVGRGYAGVRVPEPPYYFGSVQALEVDPDTGAVIGATDHRRQGTWRSGGP